MKDIDAEMQSLENRWFEAARTIKAARAELDAAEAGDAARHIRDAARERISAAEALKQDIMIRIEAIEDEMLIEG